MSESRPLAAPEAEAGVVGALMIKPLLAEKIGSFLDAAHFSDPDIAALYQLSLMACSKDQKPDAITLDELCPWLPSGAPTMATAAQIQIATPSAANAEVYARIVVERYKARSMVEVAQRITEMANSRGRVSDLAIIAGRPGTGKTVLGMNLAENVAVRCGGSSLIFSLEMSKAELAKRSLSSVSGVSQGHIESGEAIQESSISDFVVAGFGKLSEADIRICDKGALTFARIAAIARLQHRAKPLSLIVIDYIGLISTEQGSRFQNRNQELGAISRGMKALAKELGIPVVALAQLNRSIESRTDAKPRMSDLRDSGEIEQDADVIIMAHRDDDPKRGGTGITDIDVVKCRHAKPGFTILDFQGDMARFVCVADPSRYQAKEQERAPEEKKSIRSRFRGAQ